MSEFPSPPRLGRYCSLGFNELCLNSDGSTMSREQIVRERQKRGLCTTCHDHPTQCFERVVPRGGRAARIVRIVRGAALTPRNEEGVVRDGVCLRCNPPAIRTASRLSSSGSNGRQEQQHNEGGTRIERNAAEDTIASREHSPGTTSRHHHTSGASASNLETSGSGSMGSGLGSTGTAYFGSGYHSSGSNSRSENDPHHIDVSNNISHSITNISIEADCAVNGAPPPSSAGSNTASSTLLEREMSSPRTMPEAGTDEEGVGRRHHHNMERTETLSESGALAGCSSASAPQAQLDDSRQSSHSLAPPYHAAATEEYLEQAMMRQRHNILTVFQASPLVHEDDRGRIHPFEDRLDFGREREIIIESFSRAGSNVRAVFETGTTEMLSDLLANDSHGETCQVLHFSCRCGNGFLYLEDGKGGAHLVSVNDLLDFIKASGRTVLFVFIFPFHSFFAGEAFLEAGARHVVCCRGDKKLRDNTVKVFCRAFYTALASGTTLKGAFELGKYAVKMSPVLSPHSEEEMNKLILLPEDVACHDVPVFSMDNEQHAFTLSNSQQGEPWILCHPPEQFIGREKETYNIIGALHKFRLVRLIGPPGVGKTSLAAAVCQYIKPRRKSFGLQEIIWLPLIQLSHEDELTTSLLLLFELLQVKGIHDYSANGEYWKACHTIIGALQRTKAVIVVDAQYVNFEGLSMFLKELLRRTEHVRIILINNEASESSLSIGVAETTITVHPLSFRHSVMLFGAVCPFMSGSHTALTPSNLYSILVSDDEDEYRAGDEGLSERGEKTLQFIGEGIPAKVIIAAEIVKNEWLNKLVNLSKIEQNDFTNGKMTELSELAGEMIESVKNQEGIKKLGISDASSLPSFRETDGSSLEDDYLLVGVDFSTAFRDMDQDWAKNIVRQRKLIDAHLKDLLERSRRLTDEVDEPRKVLVEYVDNHRRERALVTLKMDIDIPSVGLDSLNRLKIQRCCQKIASLLRQAGVPDDELEQIMLGTLWQGSLNILLVAPSGVFVKLHSILLDGEKNIDLGDDEYLVSVRPAFVMKPTPTSLGRNLRIDVLRSISGNAEAEKGELTKGDSLFLVPTSPGASANILTGVVALLGEKRERDWIHLLPFHYKKIGMGWEAVEDEKGSAGVVEAMEASVGMSSAAAMMEVAKAAEVKESATIATESTSETWSAPPEIASALLRLSTAATADDVATACTDIGNLAKMAEMRAAIEAYNNADNIVAIGIPAIVAAIPAIVSAMERHGESASVQEKACWALAILAVNNDNRATIGTAGIRAVVAAMERHTESAEVQEQACAALRSLAYKNDNNSVKIAASGGIPAVVAAMKWHVESAAVQENACGALRNLAWNNAKNTAMIGRAGIPAIVSAMKRHTESAAVQENACAALGSLAANNDDKVAIAAEGGIDVVVSAMKRHSEVAAVQKNACRAIINLAHNNDDNTAAIGKAGIPAIVSAMERHAESAAVQAIACAALGSLAVNNDDNTATIAAKGVIPIIVSAMERHKESAAVQVQACRAIANLAVNDDIRATIAAAGAFPAVVAAMERHGESAAVQEKAIAALRNLALDDGNRAKIVTAGAIPAIVAAMKQHAEVAAVQENACKALYNLSKLSSNMPLMRSEGVQQLLEYAKRRFPSQCDRPASHVLQKL